jgi:hypothetical protein
MAKHELTSCEFAIACSNPPAIANKLTIMLQTAANSKESQAKREGGILQCKQAYLYGRELAARTYVYIADSQSS